MKHLEIEVSRYETLVFGRIVEQSHRASDFGMDGRCDFCHGGFTLCSADRPIMHDPKLLYVRGYVSDRDEYVFALHLPTVEAARACIAAMKACVAAYLRESNGETPRPVATIQLERIGG